jgi:hypothetical protein
MKLADVLGMDLIAAGHAELDKSERRYDVTTYHRSPRKAPPNA